jgi:hypothetical protein
MGDQPALRHLENAERSRLVDLAKKSVRLAFKGRPEFQHAQNVIGIRKELIAFRERTDSRTAFVRDATYGPSRKSGCHTGADAPLIAACRRALRAFKVPSSEIAAIRVKQQFGRVAERKGESEFAFGEPELLRKFAFAERAIAGIPVWSSLAMLGLTRAGAVGWFELHWPEIPDVTLREALLLQGLVKRKWTPPQVAAARPESIEAGVIHSPAISVFMDIAPAIRVVYASDDRMFGCKPTLYFDRHSNPVPYPRSVELPRIEAKEPRKRPE